MTRGIVIISCGAETDALVPYLIASLLRAKCCLPVHLHQDQNAPGIASRAVKLLMNEISPYDQTLFLDCDVLVQSDPTPLFDLLNHAPVWMGIDVGPRTVSEMLQHRFFNVCLKPGSAGRRALEFVGKRAPNAPHWNSGVVLFKKGESTRLFFEAWRTCWHALPPGQDQVALAVACYNTGVQPALLSSRWNYQHSYSQDEKNLATDRSEIRILHLLGSHKPDLYQRAANAGFM